MADLDIAAIRNGLTLEGPSTRAEARAAIDALIELLRELYEKAPARDDEQCPWCCGCEHHWDNCPADRAETVLRAMEASK